MSTPHYDKSFTEHYRPREGNSSNVDDNGNGNDNDNDKGKSSTSTSNELQPDQFTLQQQRQVQQRQQQLLRPGQLLTFSAYSVLLYLNDDFEGGETTFFRHNPAIRVSRRGLAPHPDDVDKLEPISRVEPRRGDILVFPHGKFKGCYPDPLHEGSLIRRGEKVIIRTDLVFAPAPRQKSGRKQYKKGKKRGKDEAPESVPRVVQHQRCRR